MWGMDYRRLNPLPTALPSHILLVLIGLSIYIVYTSRIMCSAFWGQKGISFMSYRTKNAPLLI